MTKAGTIALGIALAVALGSNSTLAAGDAEKGEKIFKKCAVCHSLKQDAKKKMGPSLVGLFGRTAGTFEGFKFSKALKSSEIEWNEETLDAFIANPRKYIKGTRMLFPGIKKKQDRKNVIAYIREASE